MGIWWRKYPAYAKEAALKAVSQVRSGPGELISGEDHAVLFETMASYSPEELMIGGPLGTRSLSLFSGAAPG